MTIPLDQVLIPPCTRSQLPSPGSTPLYAIASLLDEGNSQVQNNGFAWIPYSPGAGITQLTGSVLVALGGGVQPAFLGLLSVAPGSPADDTWWIIKSGISPAMSLDFQFRIDGVTVTVPIATV